MESFDHLCPRDYVLIVKAFEYLSVNSIPRNDLEMNIMNAMKKTSSMKDSKEAAAGGGRVKQEVVSKIDHFKKEPVSGGGYSRPSFSDAPRPMRIKRLCIHFRNGRCAHGEACIYAHKMCNNPRCEKVALDECKYGHDKSVIKNSDSAKEEEDEEEEEEEEEEDDA